MVDLHQIYLWFEGALGKLFLFLLFLQSIDLDLSSATIHLNLLDDALLLQLVGDDSANFIDLRLVGMILEVLPTSDVMLRLSSLLLLCRMKAQRITELVTGDVL